MHYFYKLILILSLLIAYESQATETLSTRELEKLVQAEEALFKEWSHLTQAERTQRAERLLKEYSQFTKKNPTNLEGLILAGKLCRKIDCSEQAITYFEAAHRLAPGTPIVCQQLGNYCAESMHPAEALSYFLTASKNAPQEAIYAYQVAETLLTFKDFFINKGLYSPHTFDSILENYFQKAVELDAQNRFYRLRQAEASFYQFKPNWLLAKTRWEALLANACKQEEKEYASMQLAHICYELGDHKGSRSYLNNVQSPLFVEGKYALLSQLDSAAAQ